MKYVYTRQLRLATGGALALAMLLTLSACQTAPKPLYEWGGYQKQVYAHFKNDGSAEQQIAVLEQSIERAIAHGTTPPPGYFAHLGLLYLNVGHDDKAAQAWIKEKALFPESTRYMDFLLNNMKKQGG